MMKLQRKFSTFQSHQIQIQNTVVIHNPSKLLPVILTTSFSIYWYLERSVVVYKDTQQHQRARTMVTV